MSSRPPFEYERDEHERRSRHPAPRDRDYFEESDSDIDYPTPPRGPHLHRRPVHARDLRNERRDESPIRRPPPQAGAFVRTRPHPPPRDISPGYNGEDIDRYTGRSPTDRGNIYRNTARPHLPLRRSSSFDYNSDEDAYALPIHNRAGGAGAGARHPNRRPPHWSRQNPSFHDSFLTDSEVEDGMRPRSGQGPGFPNIGEGSNWIHRRRRSPSPNRARFTDFSPGAPYPCGLCGRVCTNAREHIRQFHAG